MPWQVQQDSEPGRCVTVGVGTWELPWRMFGRTHLQHKTLPLVVISEKKHTHKRSRSKKNAGGIMLIVITHLIKEKVVTSEGMADVLKHKITIFNRNKDFAYMSSQDKWSD